LEGCQRPQKLWDLHGIERLCTVIPLRLAAVAAAEMVKGETEMLQGVSVKAAKAGSKSRWLVPCGPEWVAASECGWLLGQPLLSRPEGRIFGSSTGTTCDQGVSMPGDTRQCPTPSACPFSIPLVCRASFLLPQHRNILLGLSQVGSCVDGLILDPSTKSAGGSLRMSGQPCREDAGRQPH